MKNKLRVGLVAEMVELAHCFLQPLEVVRIAGHEALWQIRDTGDPMVDWRGECGGMW